MLAQSGEDTASQIDEILSYKLVHEGIECSCSDAEIVAAAVL